MQKVGLKMLERVARREIKKSNSGWPPQCAGIYHQPKRPKCKSGELIGGNY